MSTCFGCWWRVSARVSRYSQPRISLFLTCEQLAATHYCHNIRSTAEYVSSSILPKKAAADMSSPTASTLVPPRAVALHPDSTDGVEVSLHTLPKQLLREFRHVFSDEYLSVPEAEANAGGRGDLVLLAIPTNQHAREDLVAIGDHIEAEKDRLLNVFMSFGAHLTRRIRSLGYWADYVDPCSGLPMLTMNCNKVYSEVDGMECLLSYRSYSAGFCKILTHPRWGSAVYPATIFAHCPVEVAKEVLEAYPGPLSAQKGGAGATAALGTGAEVTAAMVEG